MALTRWLDRIDPEKWSRACRWLVDNPFRTHDEVLWFVSAFDRQPTSSFLLAIDDDYDDPERLADIRGKALELAVTEEQWHLDRSFGDLAELPRWLAGLAPLRPLADGKGLDVELPAPLRTLEAGLRGCLSSTAQALCVRALELFPTLADVRTALEHRKPGVLARLRGKPPAPAVLAERLHEKHCETMWADLVAAFRETGRRGHYLGLGLAT